jgi:hypothetical protein
MFCADTLADPIPWLEELSKKFGLRFTLDRDDAPSKKFGLKGAPLITEMLSLLLVFISVWSSCSVFSACIAFALHARIRIAVAMIRMTEPIGMAISIATHGSLSVHRNPVLPPEPLLELDEAASLLDPVPASMICSQIELRRI